LAAVTASPRNFLGENPYCGGRASTLEAVAGKDLNSYNVILSPVYFWRCNSLFFNIIFLCVYDSCFSFHRSFRFFRLLISFPILSSISRAIVFSADFDRSLLEFLYSGAVQRKGASISNPAAHQLYRRVYCIAQRFIAYRRAARFF
jgi:hypothetical protein